MLKRTHRRLQSSEIKELFKGTSNSFGNSFFRINWAPSDKDSAQFVVIVSKKVHNSAVIRNKMRRRVYTLLQSYFKEWTRGLRVAILVKSPALACSARQFEERLLKTLLSAELISS